MPPQATRLGDGYSYNYQPSDRALPMRRSGGIHHLDMSYQYMIPPQVGVPPPVWGPQVGVPPPAWGPPQVEMPPPGWGPPQVSAPPPGWGLPQVGVPPSGWGPSQVGVPPPGWGPPQVEVPSPGRPPQVRVPPPPRGTPEGRMPPPQDRTPPQITPILPSLPVKNSVLRQLGIADYELPHGLTRLIHNLLIAPAHTPPQERNICANSSYSGHESWRSLPGPDGFWFLDRLRDTIAESPSRPDPIETFKSLHYLDQIVLACLAAGCHDCRAPDCLQYRKKLESVVPVCHSWPGLRDWVLCITSCSLRTAEAIDPDGPQGLGDKEVKDGLSMRWAWSCQDLLMRFRDHLLACIVLTQMQNFSDDWDIAGRTLEADNPPGTDESGLSGSIGRPWPSDSVVSSRRCLRFTPEVLTCRRQATFTLERVGPAFLPKHLILYKRGPVLQVHQWMLLRFFT